GGPCRRGRREGGSTRLEFKSLMKTAMASLPPAEFLTRQSKTDGTPLAAEGFTEQRDRIIQIWRESRLAELGLIHPDVLVERVKQPYSFRGPDWGTELTLTREPWLLSRERVLQGANGGDNRS